MGLRAWSAPAKLGRIAYIERDGLWVRQLPDGVPQRLVNAGKMKSPKFSPSGDWIACYRDDVLHVVRIDGSGWQRLVETEQGSQAPGFQWCASGDRLLVGVESGLELFTAAEGWRRSARKLAGAELPVVFSPDGTEMVYGDAVTVGRGPGGEDMRNGRLCRISLEKGSRPVVLSSDYLAGKVPCLWTRRGDFVLYWEDPDFSGSAMSDGLELFRIPAGGGTAQSLHVSTLVHQNMFSLGRKLAISTGGGRFEWQEKRIAVIDPEGSDLSYLTDGSMAAVCPAWSPDGAAVAYSAAPGPTDPIGVSGGDEARELLSKRRIFVNGTRLTNDSRYRDEEPMWSADGSRLLFCRIAEDDSKTLWLMKADGSEAARVAGPLYLDPGPLGVDDSWFGYYGYIEWHDMFDWFRG